MNLYFPAGGCLLFQVSTKLTSYLIILSLYPLGLKLMSVVVIRLVYVAVNLVVTRTWAYRTCIH